MVFDWNYCRVVLPILKAEMNSNPNMQQESDLWVINSKEYEYQTTIVKSFFTIVYSNLHRFGLSAGTQFSTCAGLGKNLYPTLSVKYRFLRPFVWTKT